MAFRRTITERCLRLGTALATLVCVGAAPALAHKVTPQPVREVVRLQGYRGPAPQGVEGSRDMTLVVLGQQLRFTATDWRVFVMGDARDLPPREEPPQAILQGDRSVLRDVTGARPEQQITILAERRPGSSDLFVLTIDLCPPR